jgi:acylphosphatase
MVMVSIKIVYKGHVQGVGFRYRTYRLAMEHPISGYVKNLPDGSVELVAQGSQAAVDTFLTSLEDELSHYIRSKLQDKGPPHFYSEFEIER